MPGLYILFFAGLIIYSVFKYLKILDKVLIINESEGFLKSVTTNFKSIQSSVYLMNYLGFFWFIISGKYKKIKYSNELMLHLHEARKHLIFQQICSASLVLITTIVMIIKRTSVN